MDVFALYKDVLAFYKNAKNVLTMVACQHNEQSAAANTLRTFNAAR